MFYNIVKLIGGFFIKVFFSFDVKGIENIPDEGKLILCPNHISNWDPIVLSIAVPRKINWMGKKELFDIKILAFFLDKLGVFPVDRDGTDVGAIKKSFRILKDDEILGIFPEGTRVKSFDIANAKPGVSLISTRSKTPIIPVYIESDYRLFSKVKITIGEAVDYNRNIDGKASQKDYEKISKDLLYKIYNLKEEGR